MFNSHREIHYKGQKFFLADLKEFKSELYDQLNDLPPGSILLSQLSNHPIHLSYLSVCNDLKLVYLPLDMRLTESEVQSVKDAIQPTVVIRSHQVENSIERQTNAKRISGLSEGGVIFMTSGSSGRAKYIFRPFSDLKRNAEAAARHLELSPDSFSYVPLSIAHTGGMNMMLLPSLFAGARVFLTDRFHPRDFLKKCEFTHAVLVPPHLRLLKKLNEKVTFEKSLKILTGSAPVSESLFEWANKSGAQVFSVYGMTELGPFICYAQRNEVPPDDQHYILGKMIDPYEAKIEGGQIYLRGPGIGKRLEIGHEIELADLSQDWFATGDLGLKRDKTLWIRGRAMNEINCGGMKFNAEEVEQKILEMEGVSRCVVIGESDPHLFQRPVAYIQSDSSVCEAEILKYLKGKLAAYKIPKKYLFTKSLPTAAIEKVNYAKVKSRAG